MKKTTKAAPKKSNGQAQLDELFKILNDNRDRIHAIVVSVSTIPGGKPLALPRGDTAPHGVTMAACPSRADADSGEHVGVHQCPDTLGLAEMIRRKLSPSPFG